jgi:hypothetical protein
MELYDFYQSYTVWRNVRQLADDTRSVPPLHLIDDVPYDLCNKAGPLPALYSNLHDLILVAASRPLNDIVLREKS